MSSAVRFDVDDERLARAAWSRLAEPGDQAAQQLVHRTGAVAALRSVLAGEGPPRWRVRLPDLDPARDQRAVQRFGGRVLIPADPDWPAGLAALGAEAPFCLWVRGPAPLAATSERSAAIVGARAATAYGEGVAERLGSGCAERGIAVISGAAYGIDGAAHRGALAGGGMSVAVLACGIDRAYPRGHERLIGRLAGDGAVLSEVPPGSSPTRWRFVERNRLIAALARVTVVVEAAHRSGALGTAHRAARIGASVAAVPGPVTSPMSYGCHRLLRDAVAVCVTSADEVAELAAPMGEFLAPEPALPQAPHDGLDPVDWRVYDALPVSRATAVPAVAVAAGLEPDAVASALGRLELLGLADRQGSSWRAARHRAPRR